MTSTGDSPLRGRASQDGGASHRTLRRTVLALFFSSVALNAVLGIVALVAGEFSQTHGRILGTSLSVTAALVLALACLPAWERRLLAQVPVLGATCGGIGFLLVIVAIWSESEHEILLKSLGTLLTVAVASAVASLLVLPQLAPRHRPVFVVALALLVVAAAMVVVQVWGELDSSVYGRALGVVAVLLAATAVTIPVLSRMGRRPAPIADDVSPAFCPYCGERQESRAAIPTTCVHCGRTFSVHPGP